MTASTSATTRCTMSSGQTRIAVIGAGIAGSSIAQRLATRGCAVAVFDAAAGPAQGASGNLAAVFRPLPSLNDSRLSRLLRACFLYGREHLLSLADRGARFDFCGVLHLARDARHEATQRRVAAEQHFPADFCRFVERDEASRIACWPVECGGWWFERGGWINPPSVCRANLSDIQARYNIRIERVLRNEASWRLIDADGALVASADHVVFANGADLRRLFPEVPLRIGRGMVSHLPATATAEFRIVATRLGYVMPAIDGIRCTGATLAADDSDPASRIDDHIENLTRLDMILPGYGRALTAERLTGRVGFRPMSPDRLPIVGSLGQPGLWTLNGFGARGLVWAALCAELLACQISAEPLPLAAELVAALHPARFGDGATRFSKRSAVLPQAALSP